MVRKGALAGVWDLTGNTCVHVQASDKKQGLEGYQTEDP